MSKEVEPLVFFDRIDGVGYKGSVKHLLIARNDSVIITRSELEERDRKMIADAWEAACDRCGHVYAVGQYGGS